MHLTREALDAWAEKMNREDVFTDISRVHVLLLAEGDSMPSTSSVITMGGIEGPAVVKLVVYRDGGWSARALQHESVESIALAASLAAALAEARAEGARDLADAVREFCDELDRTFVGSSIQTRLRALLSETPGDGPRSQGPPHVNVTQHS